MFFFEAIFPIFFIIMFVTVFGIFAVTFFKSIKTWNANNNSPRLTVPAKVVSKRMDFGSHRHDGHTHRSTYYYVTFEFESGDRLELPIPANEYGYMVEGDSGMLGFQGTRFLSFTR